MFEGFDETAKARKHIQYLNKYLDAENISLFYSQKLILVEGISEKLLIPFFFNMIHHDTTEKFSGCVINVNGLAFSNFQQIVKNGCFRKCLVLTDSDAGTAAENRADQLAESYKTEEKIRIGVTQETTFEKDIFAINTTGKRKGYFIGSALVSASQFG